MNYTRSLSLPLLATLALGIAGCANNTPTDQATTASADAMAAATPVATATASDGAQFLTDAMKGDNSEVKLGSLASTQGSTKAVRDYGDMLVKDHGEAKQQVAGLAKSMNMPTTDDVKPEADIEYAKLQKMKGAEFDKEFITSTIDDHKKDIAAYQQEANGNDPQAVQDLASKTIPTLQKHLQAAEAM